MTLICAGSAMSAGVPNRATVSRKVMIEPPRMAGSTSGRVTLTIVRSRPAPRMFEASSSSDETSSRALEVKMKI